MIDSWLKSGTEFREEAHKILAQHESSASRVVIIEHTYSKLTCLSVKQDDLFRQSLRCIENELFRAAHVMAWAAFIDFVEDKLGEDGYAKVNSVKKDWNIKDKNDLGEKHAEFKIIEGLTLTGLIAESEERALKGLLAKRNECAHPSDYYPEMNDTLGYVTELMKRLEKLSKKKLH